MSFRNSKNIAIKFTHPGKFWYFFSASSKAVCRSFKIIYSSFIIPTTCTCVFYFYYLMSTWCSTEALQLLSLTGKLSKWTIHLREIAKKSMISRVFWPKYTAK